LKTLALLGQLPYLLAGTGIDVLFFFLPGAFDPPISFRATFVRLSQFAQPGAVIRDGLAVHGIKKSIAEILADGSTGDVTAK
jgi:hypothetical protein